MKNAFVASVLLASAAPATAKDLWTSPDGSCGPDTVFTCKQSFYGGCCGPANKCGSTADVCGTGCQKDFGYCQPATKHDKRWKIGVPDFVKPVKPATSSSSSFKASASIYPSKSLNGTKGFSHGKPTAAAAYDYASTVIVTSVATPTKVHAFPWWWPFGGNGLKSIASAVPSPTPAKGGAHGGSQAKPVVYSKFTTLTVTYTKTHTYNYKGSKSFSYETYAAPTVCPLEQYTTLSTVTKTKTHTVTTHGSTSLSYEPYVTKSLCTLERPVTTTTATSSLSSSVKPSNPWWGPAPVTTSKSSPSSTRASSASHSGHGSSAPSASPSISHSGSSSPSSTPVGPTFGSSSIASPSLSFSHSVPSGSVSVPVGPSFSSQASSSVSSLSFSHSAPNGSISFSIPSSSISVPSGSISIPSGSISIPSGSISTPVGSSFTSSEIISHSSVSLSFSFSVPSESISIPVGPSFTSSAEISSSTSSAVVESSSSSESSPAGPTITSSAEVSLSSSSVFIESSSSVESSESSPVSPTVTSFSEVSSSISSIFSESSSVTKSSESVPIYSSTSSAEGSSARSSDVSSSGTVSSDSATITSSSVSSDAASESHSATITSSASVSDSTSSSMSITSSESSSSVASSSASSSSASDSASSSSSYSSTLSTITTSSSSSASSSSSTISSSSSTTQSSCLTAPTLTAATLPNCTPCAGQPGTGQFCGYKITDNSYEVTPITCKVHYYNFDITGATFGPDGVARPVMWVNGQMPGPPITASWGDTVVVTVNNKLDNVNGTSIHFHGIRQLNNNMNDGVPSITQCPIAPGSSMTYTWVAENYGTSWYHSHFAIQAWEGVMGPMIIDGPHSDDFDEDMGPFQLQDWSHFTVDSRYDLSQNATPIPGAAPAANGAPATYGGPVLLDTGLINGMNIWNGDDQSGYVSGSRFVAPKTMTPGKKYLFRIINSAIQSTFKVYLDNHQFTVIANDFVPITPYTTNVLNINIGQRYDVIVEATESTGSFFFRADNQNACAGTVQALDIRAIVNYEGSAVTDGSSGTAYSYTGECVDEPMASLVPVAPMTVGGSDVTVGTLDVVVRGNDAQLFKWYLSGTTFMAEYNDPTLLAIMGNKTLPTDSGALLIELPQEKQWVYIIVESVIPLPHPLHLHGHDFFVLAEGSGSYSGSVPLTLINPPRRDTALMPAAGFIVLAFETDNPGVWLMHCHIGWHTSMGFALQFVEMQDQIQSSGALNNSCALNSTCNAWNDFATSNSLVQFDSGV